VETNIQETTLADNFWPTSVLQPNLPALGVSVEQADMLSNQSKKLKACILNYTLR